MSENVINSITNVADFHAQLKQLVPADGVCLYRGQADGGWPVSCAAARRFTENAASPIEHRLIGSLLPGNMEFLIARVRMAGLCCRPDWARTLRIWRFWSSCNGRARPPG